MKLVYQNFVEIGTGKGLEDCKMQECVNTNGAGRRCAEMVDLMYSGMAYELEKRLVFHAALGVLQLETYVKFDRSYSEQKNAWRRW